MNYYLKFKKINEYSLRDLRLGRASFGLFKSYLNQDELKARIDSTLLSIKYKDASLGGNKIEDLLVNHISNSYAMFCLASFLEMKEKRIIHLWEKYTDNSPNGFALLYKEEDIKDFLNKHKRNEHASFKEVKYVHGPIDFTSLTDNFLNIYTKEEVSEYTHKKYINTIYENNLNKDIYNFVFTKEDYPYPFEKESRIVLMPNNLKAKNDHICFNNFAKPLKLYLLNTTEEKLKKKVIKICNYINLPYVEVDKSDLLTIDVY